MAELTSSKLQELLSLPKKEFEETRAQAEKITLQNFGKRIHFRGIIEFSNACEKNCFYCGIRKANKIQRYSMPKKEILKTSLQAFFDGYGSVVLQSGELTGKKAFESALSCVEEIKKESKKLDSEKESRKANAQKKGLGITASLGELSKKQLEELFQAGAHRYLLRIETSNPALYKKLHPKNEKHSFKKRLKCLHNLREIGFQVGTGVMIGLPEQTIEDLANDLLFFKENDFDMFGMGPYIIHENTPAAKEYAEEWQKNKDNIFELSLKMISLLRLLMPKANIAAATALQAMNPIGRELGVEFGANIVMPNITPQKYRSLYLLYENKPCVDEDSGDCFNCLSKRLNNIDREIALNEWGDSPHFFERTEK